MANKDKIKLPGLILNPSETLRSIHQSFNRNMQLIKDAFDRLARDVPRIEQGPYYSATAITTTGASPQTISVSGAPSNAIGAVIIAQVDTTNNVALQWRQDSSDGTWKLVGLSIGGRTSHTIVGFVYFTNGGSSYDITWSGAIGTAGTNQIFHACWIY